VVQLSVQYDHLHLIVEAQDKVSLSSGMRSLAIRIARSVNTLVGRRGRFWADRWHGRALTSPRQVRTALVYVLANFRKHARRRLGPGIDPFSSGAWFDGWLSGPWVETGSVAAGSVVAVGSVGPRSEGERAPLEREFVDDRSHGRVQEALHDSEHDPGRAVVGQPSHGVTSRSGGEIVPVSRARTWLARVGWRRYGPLGLDEAPAGAPA
jgi:hypothetical protein